MTIDPKNPNHLIADEGKTFYILDEGYDVGTEIILGYHKFSDGVIRMATVDDFEEREKPEEEQNPDF